MGLNISCYAIDHEQKKYMLSTSFLIFALFTSVKCLEISPSAHLLLSNVDNSVGSIVYFTCERGWHVVGPTTTTCGNDGMWTQSPPTCALGG